MVIYQCPICEMGMAYPGRDGVQAWDQCTNGCEFVNEDRTEVLRFSRRMHAGEQLTDTEIRQLFNAYLRSEGREDFV